jgi:hypothetical protein
MLIALLRRNAAADPVTGAGVQQRKTGCLSQGGSRFFAMYGFMER